MNDSLAWIIVIYIIFNSLLNISSLRAWIYVHIFYHLLVWYLLINEVQLHNGNASDILSKIFPLIVKENQSSYRELGHKKVQKDDENHLSSHHPEMIDINMLMSFQVSMLCVYVSFS